MENPDYPPEPWIGPGISYRRHYHQALLGLTAEARLTEHGPLVLEIIPEHFFANPEPLEALAEHYRLVFHDVGLSIATVDPDEARPRRLQQLKALLALARPVLFSDHLALTRSPDGLDCGHLAPAWYTADALDCLAEHVRRCQDVLEMPLVLENIALPWLFPGSMREPEFLTHLVERTGCGLLLDLSNLLWNQRNFPDQNPGLLQDYPLYAVQQIHLAGGVYQQGWWVDSHSTPVAETSFALLQQCGSCPAVKTIVIERDTHLPSLTALLREAQHAAQRWHRIRHGDCA